MQNLDIESIAKLADQTGDLVHNAPSQSPQQFESSANDWVSILTQTLTSLGETNKTKALVNQFGLDEASLAFLLYALLPSLNSRYRDFFSKLSVNGRNKGPTADLLEDLITSTYIAKNQLNNRLDSSLIFYWGLLIKRQPNTFPNAVILPSPELINYFSYEAPQESTKDGLIKRVGLPQLDLPFDQVSAQPTSRVINMEGSFEARRSGYAYKLAMSLQMPLYQLNKNLLETSTITSQQLKQDLLPVTLNEGVLYWPNGAAALNDQPEMTSIIYRWLQLKNTWLICGSDQFHSLPKALQGLEPANIKLPPLSMEQRSMVWSTVGDKLLGTTTINYKALNANYEFWYPRITQSLERTAQTDQGKTPVTSDVMSGFQATSPAKIGTQANLMASPFSFSDMVLSSSVQKGVEHIENAYHNREELGNGKSQGVLALFEGPLGSGKTMTAECLANQLGLPLYRVNYNQLVAMPAADGPDLTALFAEAAQNSALLLFDDAEALLSNDGKNQDRDALKSGLLQNIQSYPGLIILTSKDKVKVDKKLLHEALITLTFPALTSQQQFQIFQQALSKMGVKIKDKAALEQQINQLGANGNQINNIVKNTVLAAKPEAVPLSEVVVAAKDLAKAIQLEVKKQNN